MKREQVFHNSKVKQNKQGVETKMKRVSYYTDDVIGVEQEGGDRIKGKIVTGQCETEDEAFDKGYKGWGYYGL